MTTTASILVDSSAWYALADAGDAHHKAATSFLRAHLSDFRWVTTHAIIVESWALINRRLGRHAAMTFWEQLRHSETVLVPVEASDWEVAWHIAQAFPDQTFSLVDCTTFAAMERLGIIRAFAFDVHFLVYRYGARRQEALTRLPH